MTRHKKLDRPWFEHLLQERQLSQRGFAREVGIDHARISVLFGSKGSPMSIAEAQRFSDVLRHPVHEILLRAGIHIEETRRTVQIRGYVAADGSVHMSGKGTEDDTAGPLDLPTTAFALQVRTHNTRNGWIDRWLIYLSGIEDEPEACFTELALVTLTDGSQLVGEIREGYKAGTVNVHLGPDRVRENVTAKWAMRVHWLRPSTKQPERRTA